MRTLKLIGILLLVALTLGLALGTTLAFAQAAAPAAPTIPTGVNPWADGQQDATALFSVLIESFKIAWYLGVSALLYLLVIILRGNLKIGGWTVIIPWLSKWLAEKGPAWTAWGVVILGGLGSAFGALALVVDWSWWPIMSTMFGGLVAGVQLAFSAMGMNNLVSNTKAALAAKREAVPG